MLTACVEKHIGYNSFGKRVEETAPGIVWRMGYTGRFFDIVAQLQDNMYRKYDAAIARWASTDPIGFEAGDVNLYRYVGNGPLWQVDPEGKMPPDGFPFTPCLDPTLPDDPKDAAEKDWSLCQQIRNKAMDRLVAGLLCSHVTRNNQGPFQYEDDGLIWKTYELDIYNWMAWYAVKKWGLTHSERWTKINIGIYANMFDYYPAHDLKPSAVECFWISTPWELEVSGSYEAKVLKKTNRPEVLSTNYKVDLRNMAFSFKMKDRIDANAFWEYPWKEDPWVLGIIEGCGDFYYDRLWAAAFDIEVTFHKSIKNLEPKIVIDKW